MTPVWLTDTVTPDLDRALHYTLLWGLEGVVLRTVGSRGDRVPHVNEAKLKRRLAEHEMDVAAVDPGFFEGAAEARGAWLNELVLLEEVVAFCKRTGCERILIGGLPGDTQRAASALHRAGDVAAKSGTLLCVQNEYEARSTGAALGTFLDTVDHAHVRAAWDPAAALEAGEGWQEGLEALGERIAFVSVRDGAARPDGWRPASIGEGEVGWAPLLGTLHRAGYDGPLSLDLRDLAVAKEGLGEATAMIRLLRQARRG